ncbi:MAG: Circadian clock protein kinase KaiC [Candidatus Heimdallarchaeota archaeon AB_125]|nr:MAG: Circadian clock protein kinase KaiC [Candidatus Heimdallarchaeota archaeon AB_125]
MIISTGIEELDKMIDGGLRTGFCYAIKGSAGSGKTVLSLNMTMGALKKDIPVLFISTEVDPEKLVIYGDSFNMNLKSYIDKGILAFEKMSLKPKGTSLVQTDKFDLSAIIARTKSKMDELKAKLVIFDSISAFFAEFIHEKTARSNFMDFIREITDNDAVLILTAESQISEEYSTIEEYLVDGVIRIRTELKNNQLIKRISIPKLRSAKPINFENRFIINRDGVSILRSEQPPMTLIQEEKIGIEKLDEKLGGGILSGSVVLIETDGETNYFPLFLQIMCSNLERNKGVIIHSNVHMYSNRIVDEFKRVDYDITPHLNEGNIIFIDKYNRSVTEVEAREMSQLMTTDDMISVTVELMEAFRKSEQKVTLFGDLTDDANILTESNFLRYFALQSFNVKEQSAIAYSFINFNAISREMLARLRNTADTIIRFSREDYTTYIECLKSSTGATFLPKVVKYKDKMPLIEILD